MPGRERRGWYPVGVGDARKTTRLACDATVVASVAGGPRLDVARELGGRVGAVVLEEQIGEGGMGVVWRGRHEILGRVVAVKFLTEAVEEGDPGFAAFVEGARAAAAVRHEGLVQVHDAGVISLARKEEREMGGLGDGGTERTEKLGASGAIGTHPPAPSLREGEQGRSHTPAPFLREGEQERKWHVPFLVMELVDGPGLDSVLRICGAMSLGATLAVMEQVCSAIGELHAAGFVHRDIKPGNILLDSDGRVHVTDFGLACERPSHRPLKAANGGTDRAAVSGTPAYMAPEMFAGELSARSDVYALAVMMFELLAGEVPFTGDVLAVKRKHEEAAFPRAVLEARGVPGAVIEVIERGMVKSAMLRPRSAGHWLESLRAAVRDRGVWESGAREVKGLVARARGKEVSKSGAGESTSYYESIALRAEEKRKSVAPVEEEPVEAGPAAPETAKCVCGYALGGLSTTGRCPECGGLIAESVKPVSVACVGCGYDLVGISGKCPECGRDVADSVWPSRLVFADADWLKRIARGMRLIGWGLWLMPALMLVLMLLSVMVMGRTPTASMGAAIAVATALGLMTATVLFCVGVIHSTAREPGTSARGGAWWTRRVWLGGAALVAAGAIAEQVEPKFPERFFVLPGVHLLLVGVVLFGAMVERIGERIPDRKLVKSGRSVFWPWVAILVTVMAVTFSKSAWIGAGIDVDEVQLLGAAWVIGMLYSALLAGAARRKVLEVAKIARPRMEVAGPRVEKRAARRGLAWGAGALAVLTFSVVVVPLFLMAPLARLGTYVLAERIGLLQAPPGMPGYTEWVEGREFHGKPSRALNAVCVTILVVGIYGLPVLLGFWVYLKRALLRPRPDGVTRCGWCGYELAGLKEARCPECGVEIGGEPGERGGQAWTAWKWWRGLVVRMAGAWAVFPAIEGLLFLGVIATLRVPAPTANMRGVVTIVATHVPAFVAALVAFHFLARGMAGLRGKTWCGGCGKEMKGGACGCGERVVE